MTTKKAKPKKLVEKYWGLTLCPDKKPFLAAFSTGAPALFTSYHRAKAFINSEKYGPFYDPKVVRVTVTAER